ncbi:MAG: YihY/virulence factor BrkB family protein [Acidobacteria bacterium]|nr:MAG: YihY/virulence factor BrkB family protein [Acidobacteriota bacterium]
MSNGPVVKTVQLLVVSARSWIDDRVIRLGAAVAYYSLFTLIPVLFLAVSLASIFFGQDRVDAEVEKQIADLLGDDIASAVTSAFEQLQDVDEGTIVSLVTLGVLLFTATLLFVAWKDVVDIIWGAPRVGGARGTIQRRLFGVLAVFGAGALLTLTLLAEAVIGMLDRVFGSLLADILIKTTGSLIPLALGAVFLAVLYKYTPEDHVAWRSVWLPSFVAMAMLSVGASAYGLYVSAYAFRSAAGAAGSVFLGLIFVYYAAQILLYGVEIMKEQQRMIDSTSPADSS